MNNKYFPQERKIIDFKLTCNKCKEVKSLDDFHNRKDVLSGKNSWCKICVRSAAKARHEYLADDNPDIIHRKRICKVCALQQPLTNFSRDKECKFGRSYKCKRCRVKLEQYGPDWHKNRRIIKGPRDEYGLTLGDRKLMLAAQMDVCANRGCGEKISVDRKAKDRAHVDHCHATGKIRGLLCKWCNVSLGFLKEDKNRILGLTEYLQKHTEG